MPELQQSWLDSFTCSHQVFLCSVLDGYKVFMAKFGLVLGHLPYVWKRRFRSQTSHCWYWYWFIFIQLSHFTPGKIPE